MRGLIINHHSKFLEQLVKLSSEFAQIEVIDYQEFSIEKAEKYDFIILSGGSINISKESSAMIFGYFHDCANKMRSFFNLLWSQIRYLIYMNIEIHMNESHPN